eukprot:6720879-Prymnesium_polylepis.1
MPATNCTASPVVSTHPLGEKEGASAFKFQSELMNGIYVYNYRSGWIVGNSITRARGGARGHAKRKSNKRTKLQVKRIADPVQEISG